MIFLLTVPGLSPAIAGVRTHSPVQATFHVTLACADEIPLKSHVRLILTSAPFTIYEALTDSSGTAIIQNLTGGQYNIQVHRFNYGTWYGLATIWYNYSLNVQLTG